MSDPLLNQPTALSSDIGCHDGMASLACLVVTYHPEIEQMERLLNLLSPTIAALVVDNASGDDAVKSLNDLIAGRERAGLILNNHNIGLAAAVNQGIKQIKNFWPAINFVLLLDQDSEPLPGSIEIMMKTFFELEEAGSAVACVGPNLLDSVTGLSHGFHQYTSWRWIRFYPDEYSVQPVPCANLNGSGTLMPIDLFWELGGLEEIFFIDHVDTEWSFRVLSAGYTLFGVPQAHFIHSMGESSCRFWFFGWRVWPLRSPQRHYYLFRNAVYLMRRDYVPRVWKAWAMAKLFLTAIIHGIMDSQRRAQVSNMLKGVRDGMKNKSAQ